MASWEDLADEPDVVEPVSIPIAPYTGQDAGRSSPLGLNPTSSANSQNAPPKPLPRPGASDASSISQAYNAAQPKMRILQRQPQASAQQRAATSTQQTGDADESAARLHANFEQKQRQYEAARARLFDDGVSSEEGAN